MKSFAPFGYFKRAFAWFFLLIFFGSLFWAREQDCFSRSWFSIKSVNGISCDYVVLRPKLKSPLPAIVFVHDSDKSLMEDGNDMRQLSELGFIVISLEYDKTNLALFDNQFRSANDYIARQPWVDTNSIIWVGCGMGANRIAKFAISESNKQPRLLVLFGDVKMSQPPPESAVFRKPRFPTLVFLNKCHDPLAADNTQNFIDFLVNRGISVQIKSVQNPFYDANLDRGVILRIIGEHCRTSILGEQVWSEYRSIGQIQKDALSLWLFWLPAIAFSIGFLFFRLANLAEVFQTKASARLKTALKWGIGVLMMCVGVETVFHVIVPQLFTSERTISFARTVFVQPDESDDFNFLAGQPIWHSEKLQVLLDHLKLSEYNRKLVGWQVDDSIYRDFVLSPIITGEKGEHLNWRRQFWEEFYPRIRHESSTANASLIIARHLRERVTIANVPHEAQGVPEIWLRQVSDDEGFQATFVAAMRSVGIPSRLDANGRAEYWDGRLWCVGIVTKVN